MKFSKLTITCAMPRKFQFRYNAGIPGLIQTPRVQAVARERAFLRRNRNVPFLFGHTDHVALAMRQRARDRMHTIVREQQYLKQYPRISKYMPRRLLRKPQYPGFGKFIKRLSDGRRLFQFGVKPRL